MKDFFLRLWLLAIVVTAPFPVAAHEAQSGWTYDSICCNGNAHTGDCQRIPRQSVKAVEGWWQVTLRPGEHVLVTKSNTWLKEYDKTRESKDGDFHACLWPSEETLRCLYVPSMGF